MKKRNPAPEPEEAEHIFAFSSPALRSISASRVHAASPRPLARTHDTNTKRKRNQFPGSGGTKALTPLNLRSISTWDYKYRKLDISILGITNIYVPWIVPGDS